LAERQNLRVLFVCKANLKTNIKREIKKFTGKDAVVYSGVSPDKLSLAYMITQKTQYNIIGMEVIGRGKHEEDETHMPWVELINLSQFDRIFYDEAHLLKNMDSKRSKAARNLDNPTVDFFSGTPLVNRPKELYPMLNILDKSTFNNEASFINNFSDGKNGVKNLKALQEILKMYMIRRKNEDLDVKRITQTFELSSMARAIYNKALEGLYISLRKGTQTDINSILTQILRLKQIVAEDSVDFTVELARETQDQTEKKVIIFSQFKDIHALVSRKLGSSCIVINGDVSSDDRRYELVDQFQDPNSEVKFLVTNIMEGLTLTEAWTTIFNDLWWTPKDHIQGEGRCFGRTNDYHGGVSYYVTADNTIIQMIEALLSEKMDTISKVVDDIHKETMMNGSVVQELIKRLMSGM
jgi:SNF2 family DNA or RNA helicase